MNYKIKVTPETSAEVQELFFELGYGWHNDGKKIIQMRKPYLIASNNFLSYYLSDKPFNEDESEEITLPQLLDLVVLNRNSVGDATHTYKCDKLRKYYIGHSVYRWHNSSWQEIPLNETYISGWLELIGDNTEMTWEDALCEWKDGKEVEVKNISWFDINDLKLGQIKKGRAFRLKPQTIHIDGGAYTKEELLKIAGGME